MDHIGSTLPRLTEHKEPEIQISAQKLRKAELIELVRRQRETGQQDLVYTARPFLLCGLPVKRPPSGTLLHERRNGRFFLQVHAHPNFGLPFGQDRLIAIWVASLAIRQNSRTIAFDSASEILKEFGLPRNGFHYKRLMEGFQRLFASTIYFGSENQTTDNPVFGYSRFCFFDRIRLWYGHSDGQCHSALGNNHLQLSEPFWRELKEHPIPVEKHVVQGLANAPGCLDLYLWLAWRCYTARRREPVKLFGPSGLAAQLGSDAYERPRDFRRTLVRWLDTIHSYWPDCQATLSSDGQALWIEPRRAVCTSS